MSVLAMLLSTNVLSGGELQTKEDAVKGVLHQLETAWAKSDAKAFAAAFSEDADFTVWSGMRIKTRVVIEEGHKGIFEGPYKGTQMVLKIDLIRWYGDNVAVVLTQGKLMKGSEDLKRDGKQTIAMSKHGDKWLIDTFQNTIVQDWTPPKDGDGK
ncbi:MAG: SgcJ/EcaC family oxidoreductase [Armatimonadetes bacterium]|nr:SgcJ/EcaC family oxidoreductase [Armatimonadota bacterium]